MWTQQQLKNQQSDQLFTPTFIDQGGNIDSQSVVGVARQGSFLNDEAFALGGRSISNGMLLVAGAVTTGLILVVR